MSPREYTPVERLALRSAFDRPPEEGPAAFACGPYWPDELERQAANMEHRIPKLRLAAAALRREIARDDRCSSAAGVPVDQETHEDVERIFIKHQEEASHVGGVHRA